MKIKHDLVYKIALNLPFGEKRTEKEILRAIKEALKSQEPNRCLRIAVLTDERRDL